MIGRLTFLVLLLLLLACEKKRRPEGILGHQDMVKVLREIYIAEDKVNRMGVQVDSSARIIEIMKEKIAEKTGIPDSTFRKSMRYYINKPKELELIYSALVDSLNLQEQRLSVQQKVE